MADCLTKIQVLLPALITNKKQEKMTEESLKSTISFEHCVKVTIDNNKYDTAIAGAWNVFMDNWRGKDYDFLIITANDVVHDPMCIDFMVRYANETDSSVVTAKVVRDKKKFLKNFGQHKYKAVETVGAKDPASILLRKGVIEKVGRVDEAFPLEFVERDYLYRCKLAGFEWRQPDMELDFHPPYAGTIGNDFERLQKALKRYILKWGGDANQEVWQYPMNDARLNFTYCMK